MTRPGKLPLKRIGEALMGALREIVHAGPTTGVVFHHIPKCAGNSVKTALRRVYAPWTYRELDAPAEVLAVRFLEHDGDPVGQDVEGEEWNRVHAFRQRLLLTHLFSGAAAISGHVIYHPSTHDKFGGSHKFVTVLRNPIDRFVSQYLQSTRARAKHRYHSCLSWDKSGLSRIGPAWGSELANYLGGADRVSGKSLPLERMVANAKLAIDRFDIVGNVDDMESFREKLSRQLGVNLMIEMKNISTVQEKEGVPLSEIRSLVEEFCAPDLEVYNYAQSRYYCCSQADRITVGIPGDSFPVENSLKRRFKSTTTNPPTASA